MTTVVALAWLQAIRLAAALAKSGGTIDANRQLGFITSWWAMGPLAGEDQAGAGRDDGPERFDLKEMRDGLSGPVGWKAVSLPKGGTFIDLKKELEQVDDAVAYLWTAVEAPKDLSVELRGGADDNLQVWLNGTRVIDERDLLRTNELGQPLAASPAISGDCLIFRTAERLVCIKDSSKKGYAP